MSRATRPRLRDRSTGDLLVLMIAGTVCFAVLATGAAIFAAELINPDVDTSGPSGQVGDVINTLIGLLAGFLAGRTDAVKARHELEDYKRHEGEGP
jgi:hypothetical protein